MQKIARSLLFAGLPVALVFAAVNSSSLASPSPMAHAAPQEKVTFGDDDEEAEEEDDSEAPAEGVISSTPPEGATPELLEALTALEHTPTDVGQLTEVAKLAQAAKLPDEALWYVNMALTGLGDDNKVKKQREALLALRTEIGVPGPTPEELQEGFGKSLLALAKTCKKRKLYTNAADLLQRCYGTPMESRAEKDLLSLFSKKQAVEGLLATGIPIDIPVNIKVNAKKKKKVDEEQTVWSNAYEVKGDHYELHSDMGYDYTHAFVNAMDQMNAFYREVFNYKTRGQSMRTCVIEVYKSREVFDEIEKENRGKAIDANVRGFFVPGENRVATYDPRSEGGTIADLWSTLFHESSHQFTAAVAPGLLLTWLNEGTASYFEGAFLQPGGSVATNRIPEGRLKNLQTLIGRGSPTLKDVVTYYAPGSYEGSMYPFGWGLVYFLHNYEDENSERVYLPVYKEFLLKYKSASQHDVLARFVEYYVEQAEQPGIETFKDFETRWKNWIDELHQLHFGGSEEAIKLVARAEKQIKNEKLEYARESLRWALEKNPHHTKARLLLAEVLTELERMDGAVYQWRQLEAIARSVPEGETELPHLDSLKAPELRARAQEELTEIDTFIGNALKENMETFITESVKAVQSYVDAERPLSALHLLDISSQLVGGDARFIELADKIQDDSGKRLTRAYRVPVDAGLEGWTGSDSFVGAAGEISIDMDKGLRTMVHDTAPPIPYRFEVEIDRSGKVDFAPLGIVFGSDLSGDSNYAWVVSGKGGIDTLGHYEFTEQGPKLKEQYLAPPAKGEKRASKEKMLLAIQVEEDRLVFFANGKEVGQEEIPLGSANGRIGVFVQGTQATFKNMRLEY